MENSNNLWGKKPCKRMGCLSDFRTIWLHCTLPLFGAKINAYTQAQQRKKGMWHGKAFARPFSAHFLAINFFGSSTLVRAKKKLFFHNTKVVHVNLYRQVFMAYNSQPPPTVRFCGQK